jgi:hypothetical protein
MRELALSAQTQAIFDRIKSYAWTLNVYGLSPSRALWLVKARTESRVNKAGVTPPYSNFYRRYLLMRAGNACHSEAFDAEESSSAKTLRRAQGDIKNCPVFHALRNIFATPEFRSPRET